MTNEERKNFLMKRNIKLSPAYIALTWDVIFVWTIITLFMTGQKGLSFSQVVTLDSVRFLFSFVLCVPVSNLFKKIDSVTATRIACLGYAFYLVITIIGTKFITFVLSQAFIAFGYIVNSVKINSLLTGSLSVVKRDKDYSRVFGRGLSVYYIIESIGAIAITYIYTWKPYFPFWIALGIVLITIILSFFLHSPEKFQKRNIDLSNSKTEKPVENNKGSYGEILKSGFVICLLFFAFMVRGSLSIESTSLKIYVQQMIDLGKMPVYLFGYLVAVSRLCTAISSKYQFKFNLKFGVRSLLLFVGLTIITMIGRGALYLINPTSTILMIFILILSFVQCMLLMPLRIFINNYLNVCIPTKNQENAVSLKTMAENLGFASFSAIYSSLLTVFDDNFGKVNLVYSAIFVLPLVFATIIFVKALIKKYAKKYTIIKDKYVDD